MKLFYPWAHFVQHEAYVNNTSTLHKLEQEINVLCEDVKKLKTLNAEWQSRFFCGAM
jgi:hypothetical protein